MSKFTCTLADLAFTLYARYPATEQFCRDYLASGDGIAIAYSASEMAAECEMTGMPPPLCELTLLYRKICRELLRRDGMVFHASVVAVGGRAYGFTAPSGTG